MLLVRSRSQQHCQCSVVNVRISYFCDTVCGCMCACVRVCVKSLWWRCQQHHPCITERPDPPTDRPAHTHTRTHTHTLPSTSLSCWSLLGTCAFMFERAHTQTHTHKGGGAKKVKEADIKSNSRQTAFGQCVMDGWMLVLLNCCKSCAIYHFKSIIVYPLKLQVQPEWAVPFIIWPPGWPPGCHKWRWSMDQHSTGSTGNKNILSLRYWFGTMQSDSSFKCV